MDCLDPIPRQQNTVRLLLVPSIQRAYKTHHWAILSNHRLQWTTQDPETFAKRLDESDSELAGNNPESTKKSTNTTETREKEAKTTTDAMKD